MFTLMFYAPTQVDPGWTHSRTFHGSFLTHYELYNYLKPFDTTKPIYCMRYQALPNGEMFYSQAFSLGDLRNINPNELVFRLTLPDPEITKAAFITIDT